MLVKTFGSAVYGVEALQITIEVNWIESGEKEGFRGLIVPAFNAKEAELVNSLDVYGVKSIREARINKTVLLDSLS